MNTANLQLEGLIMAIAAVNRALVEKGVLSAAEIERTLAITEQTALGDDRSAESLSPANRDAVVFPVRVLRLANEAGAQGEMASFSDLARKVGETKGHYNDQL